MSKGQEVEQLFALYAGAQPCIIEHHVGQNGLKTERNGGNRKKGVFQSTWIALISV
ncbi:hypothetical protein N1037_00290 [Phaeobacter sp. G2]|nr:hypothetical protein N1037_00290 [Phaeobacter sp. G2]